MAAGGFIRSWRDPQLKAWLVLGLTVMVPLIALLIALQDEFFGHSQWSEICTLRVPFKGFTQISCAKLRVLSFALSAVGVFGIIVLTWWLLSDLIGLRRIFEVPWFGVGDDVENVDAIESVVRAALFVVAFWISFGLCAVAFLGMAGGVDGRNEPPAKQTNEPKPPGANTPSDAPKPGEKSSLDLAPFVAAANALTGEVKGIREQLAGRQPPVTQPPVSDDAAVVGELRKLGNDLAAIHGVLKSQDEKLAMLRQKLAQWEPGKNEATILAEVQHLGFTLGQIRALLDAQGVKLAALEDIRRVVGNLDTRSLPGIADKVGELLRSVDGVQQSERTQTDVLERIERLLRPRAPPPPGPTGEAPPGPDPGGCSERRSLANLTPDAATRAQMEPREERKLTVFFDRANGEMTPGARANLQQLVAELKRVEKAEVSVHGSADLQGDRGLNEYYARERAKSVVQFLKQLAPQLQPKLTSFGTTDPPLSEPYNRIARVEASWPCR